MKNAEACRLLSVIDQVSFAMDDTRLFLDTHPGDQNALSYFHKLSHMRENALAEYTAKFGPLNAGFVYESNTWQWNTCPYPWEVE